MKIILELNLAPVTLLPIIVVPALASGPVLHSTLQDKLKPSEWFQFDLNHPCASTVICQIRLENYL